MKTFQYFKWYFSGQSKGQIYLIKFMKATIVESARIRALVAEKSFQFKYLNKSRAYAMLTNLKICRDIEDV